MGKQRRKRTSFHTSPATRSTVPPNIDEVSAQDQSADSLNTTPINFTVPDNLFANVNINFALIKQSLNDDTRSVKSFKSAKSDLAAADKAMSKKDKLKLRKELLLQKIDALNQQKKEANKRNKRRKLPVIGDTNPLLDALPSLESLMTKKREAPVQKSSKCIQKATKRKKEAIKNMQIYKSITKKKEFIANPLLAVTQHIRAVVEEEKMKQQIKKTNKK